MTDLAKELSSTAIAGEVGREAGRRGCSTSVLPKDFYDLSAKSPAGADAPDPLRPVGHLPRAAVEGDRRGIWS
ncbi:hypothetical protein [Litorimonas sp. WD9-15]|uniref:hypothetical protein n=1 Tax=Litorimonas sp. WD9-15 TaxID=3418716 RepID=UPI003CFCFD87